MVGNKKNREKLVAALVAAGMTAWNNSQEVRIKTQDERNDVVYLQNSRAQPTFIEYSVSWYDENLPQSSVEEMATRIKEIRSGGERDKLRQLRDLFVAISENGDGPSPDMAYCESRLRMASALVDGLRTTDVWYKANYLLDYYRDFHQFSFTGAGRDGPDGDRFGRVVCGRWQGKV